MQKTSRPKAQDKEEISMVSPDFPRFPPPDFRRRISMVSPDFRISADTFNYPFTDWAKKLPIQVVQELAGRSDISTTRKYYLSVRSEDLASANKFLNKILAKVRAN